MYSYCNVLHEKYTYLKENLMCNLTTWHHLMKYQMRNLFRLANRFKNISQSQKAKAEMKEGIQLTRMTYTFG